MLDFVEMVRKCSSYWFLRRNHALVKTGMNTKRVSTTGGKSGRSHRRMTMKVISTLWEEKGGQGNNRILSDLPSSVTFRIFQNLFQSLKISHSALAWVWSPNRPLAKFSAFVEPVFYFVAYKTTDQFVLSLLLTNNIKSSVV